jgi:hypothetical protein
MALQDGRAGPHIHRHKIEYRSGSMEEIETFLAVIEAGSQTAAARPCNQLHDASVARPHATDRQRCCGRDCRIAVAAPGRALRHGAASRLQEASARMRPGFFASFASLRQ